MRVRARFDKELEKLEDLIIKMGVGAEGIVDLAFKSLVDKDRKLANDVIEMDKNIDQLELEIENKCLNLIALQQPLAGDLREISGALKIITDLERIGDYGVNIAKVALEFGDEKFIKELIDLPEMNRIVKTMIKGCIDAYVNKDSDKARDIALLDDKVDDLYEKIYSELLDITNKDNKSQIIRFLFIGRHLERIADHVINICQRVIYMVDGIRETY
ncbi:phosphate signaling complex protein PhoU [Helicovermis profundi]|uniref:Phosphate-specific transport system accessory protein PhoU n=1 Tax=Helicovermis profundi TaxID=3065157 RepID=A0AAU9EFZ2_9FIRM|nr:phosphate signaling complex protein PhoU [Clostridia bacterium S502]